MVKPIDVLEIIERISGKVLSVRSRKGMLVYWRGMYCKIAHEKATASLREIGEAIGRDHSTVIYWVENFENIYFTHPEFKEYYDFVAREVQMLADARWKFAQVDTEAEEIINSMIEK